MNTELYFPGLILTHDQQRAVEKIESFLHNEKDKIFILKGYAGTGKTTLITGIVKFLIHQEARFQIMAPTNRAVKVLKEKLKDPQYRLLHGNLISTIHKGIYIYPDPVVNAPIITKKLPIKAIEHDYKPILIIDEASMISSKSSKLPYFYHQDGSITDLTYNLLEDLLTYAKVHTLNTKIIFIGDPAQLPPVGDEQSWALNTQYFLKKNIPVQEASLKEIKRQEKNLILRNSLSIREKIGKKTQDFSFSFDNHSFVKLDVNNLVNQYIKENPTPSLNSSVIIAYSNKQCYEYNIAIRQKYFPHQQSIMRGDIIQIIGNDYHNFYPIEVCNGDFAQVLNVNPQPIIRKTYVSSEEKGEKKKISITLIFRRVTLLLDHHQIPLQCLIFESLLNSAKKELTADEVKALYKIAGTDRTTHEMFNAIKCKYGYAITCHKAQGGEWEKVFVDYDASYKNVKDPYLRWCYTATTRGEKTCYAINPPHFSSFSKLKISAITPLKKIPKEAINFKQVPLSPHHTEGQHPCKSFVYWHVANALKATNTLIATVLSREYLERYTLHNANDCIVIEGIHDSAGIFKKGFKVISSTNNELAEKIHHIFNNIKATNLPINYNPTLPILGNLYAIMQKLCNELNVHIVNVLEYIADYYVIYYLQTDSILSSIQFYFDNNHAFTLAQPKTCNCANDEKLNTLLHKLQEHVV